MFFLKTKYKNRTKHKKIFTKKSNIKHIRKLKKSKIFFRLFTFFCKRKNILDFKILNFLYFTILSFLKNSEPLTEPRNNYGFTRNYKILFLFLKFLFLLINFLNNTFKMNSEKFFSKKKDLSEFIFYYKFNLLVAFLGKNKNNNFHLKNLSLKLYFNYLLFSVYFFLKSFIHLMKEIELKKKKKDFEIGSLFSDIIRRKSKKSHSFYKTFIFKSFHKSNFKDMSLGTPIHLFCNNRVTKRVLDDNKFSRILSLLRQTLRHSKYKNMRSLSILKKIIKKSIPLSKIIYQRRGRIFIPILTYFFRYEIRESIGIKHIYKNCDSISNTSKNTFENKILISLLDILLIKDKLVFQSDINMSTRKEALNKGYIFKTIKPWLPKQ